MPIPLFMIPKLFSALYDPSPYYRTSPLSSPQPIVDPSIVPCDVRPNQISPTQGKKFPFVLWLDNTPSGYKYPCLSK